MSEYVNSRRDLALWWSYTVTSLTTPTVVLDLVPAGQVFVCTAITAAAFAGSPAQYDFGKWDGSTLTSWIGREYADLPSSDVFDGPFVVNSGQGIACSCSSGTTVNVSVHGYYLPQFTGAI